jgi:hypothetical protein
MMNAIQMWKSPDGIQPYERVGFPQNVVSMNPRSIFYNNIPSFSFFTASDENNPLPVTLVDLTGKLASGVAVLTWATRSESQNKGFHVQRSLDGQQFKTIGFVRGKGESNARFAYRFEDSSFNRYAYYRLEQEDENGITTLSNMIYLSDKSNNGLSDFTVYPNPTKGQVYFRLNQLPLGNEWLKVRLWDMKGALVFEGEQTAAELSDKLRNVLSEQAQGLYLLDAYINNQQFRIKLNKEN